MTKKPIPSNIDEALKECKDLSVRVLSESTRLTAIRRSRAFLNASYAFFEQACRAEGCPGEMRDVFTVHQLERIKHQFEILRELFKTVHFTEHDNVRAFQFWRRKELLAALCVDVAPDELTEVRKEHAKENAAWNDLLLNGEQALQPKNDKSKRRCRRAEGT